LYDHLPETFKWRFQDTRGITEADDSLPNMAALVEELNKVVILNENKQRAPRKLL
jgi:hypothetical protein